jgi:hypothetical protein
MFILCKCVLCGGVKNNNNATATTPPSPQNQRKQQLDVLSLPPLLDSQVDEITKGLSPFFNKNCSRIEF